MNLPGRYLSALAITVCALSAQAAAQGIGDPAVAAWARRVSFLATRSTLKLSRQLRDGRFELRFTIAPDGSASGFTIEGTRPEPAQYALLTGALALTFFPPPPDGLSHVLSLPVHVFTSRRAKR